MTKKTYMKPATIEVRIDTMGMIAQSTVTVYSDDTEGVSSEEDLLSRKSVDIWGDDEE